MGEENRRQSRRIQGLEPKTSQAPSPRDLPNIETHMEEEETHSETRSIPPLEEHIEGHVETIKEGTIPHFNPPLTNMDIHVLIEVPFPSITVQYQRVSPEIRESSLGYENYPSLTQCHIFYRKLYFEHSTS